MSLKELRLKRGLTQAQLADKVPGVNQARISAYETGVNDIGNMTLRTALQLCDALRVANPRKLLDNDTSGDAHTAA